VDELYVVARRVLLDALEALGPHRDAVVVVGAYRDPAPRRSARRRRLRPWWPRCSGSMAHTPGHTFFGGCPGSGRPAGTRGGQPRKRPSSGAAAWARAHRCPDRSRPGGSVGGPGPADAAGPRSGRRADCRGQGASALTQNHPPALTETRPPFAGGGGGPTSTKPRSAPDAPALRPRERGGIHGAGLSDAETQVSPAGRDPLPGSGGIHVARASQTRGTLGCFRQPVEVLREGPSIRMVVHRWRSRSSKAATIGF
jgi:hypothetical protein